MHVDSWIIAIGGNLQRPGKLPGMWQISEELRRLYEPRVNCLYVNWDFDADDLAELIARTAPRGRRLRIMVLCYSWGAGRGLVALALALRRRGIDIDVALVVDPIYFRSRWFVPLWLLRWLQPLALSRWLQPLVRIPGNVRHVSGYYQRGGRPMSPGVCVEDATQLHRWEQIHHVDHLTIDDHPRIRINALGLAEKLFGRPGLPAQAQAAA